MVNSVLDSDCLRCTSCAILFATQINKQLVPTSFVFCRASRLLFVAGEGEAAGDRRDCLDGGKAQSHKRLLIKYEAEAHHNQ